MKVESSPDSYIGSVAGGPQKVPERPTQGAEAAASGAAAAQPPQAGAGVTVSLSASTASALQGAAASGNEVFNADKVQAMKSAIENGSFQVNAEAIADKMLSNAAEMLSASSGR